MFNARSNLQTQDFVTGQVISIEACETQVLHLTHAIQPSGVLLVVHPKTGIVEQASANAPQWLGRALDQILGSNLADWLTADSPIPLMQYLAGTASNTVVLGNAQLMTRPVTLRAHAFGEAMWVELEPGVAQKTHLDDLSLYGDLRPVLARFLAARTPQALCETAAGEFRRLTGFDRVMVYQFDADYNGAVVAEDKHPDLEPYLGLHYPASDIPAQARVLYLKNTVRHIPQVTYTPVPIVPTLNPRTGQPVDLTYADLRSFDSSHREYLQNMGVEATLVVSLVIHGQLWGLVSAHHRQAHHVPVEMRLLADMLGHMLAAQLTLRLDEAALQARLAYGQCLRALDQQMLRSLTWPAALCDGPVTLQQLVDCTGAALCVDGSIWRMGRTPSEQDLYELVDWLQAHHPETVFATSTLSQHYAPARNWADMASGLLAVALAEPGAYAVWFRPEAPQTVAWAGNPHQVASLEQTADGQTILHPRRSFAQWQDIMRLTSHPWQAWEQEAAQALRLMVLDMLVRNVHELRLRANLLARLNAELERSNAELDAFAYTASHDLREPLRGIRNYADFLLEDYAAQMDAAGQHKLHTLIKLARRMEALLESLLQYARVGRLELNLNQVNLQASLADVLEELQPRLHAHRVEVRVPRPLPTVRCDAVRVAEVLTNLLTNAIKYRPPDQAERWVEVGYLTPQERGLKSGAIVFYVRDNGIGVAPIHHDTIFHIFKRLHPQEAYGGGTGAGLAIVKKIIERHHGLIWIESQLGVGTTFYFTLSADNT